MGRLNKRQGKDGQAFLKNGVSDNENKDINHAKELIQVKGTTKCIKVEKTYFALKILGDITATRVK